MRFWLRIARIANWCRRQIGKVETYAICMADLHEDWPKMPEIKKEKYGTQS